MEVDMLGNAIEAFHNMINLERMGFLTLGVLMGLVLGVIPGLGGLVGLSLLLPFTFNMDPLTALAFMMGLQAVVCTSDTIPGVLFGVPGTVGSAATILDGYPMARKGEAGRAFGAAFSASVIGGVFGAFLLAISVPILRPLVLEIGSPELLAICVFGLSLVAVLSGSSPLKGLAAACIGLMVSTAGDDPQTGTLRWTFDSLYLWDGLPVVPLALGLFAIPELADMAITGQSIKIKNDEEEKQDVYHGQMQGIRDTLDNWFLVLRCSTIGAALGAVPGIGASVIDWIAYGHAARTEKDAGLTFGKGDVRGVIASESSNNAKEGGALVPTVAFGVPGSASMALILGAFLIHGLVPGPEMLSKRLDVTYTLVWSVAFANIIGAGICFAFANQLAKVAIVRIGILAPVVLAVTYVGAFQGSRQWGDIWALLIFGAIGWVMKRLRWPRPPLILGFILGALVERYLFISVERYGADWLWIWRDFGDGEQKFAPYVPVIFAITLYGILAPIVKGYRLRAKHNRRQKKLGFQKQSLNTDFFFGLFLFVLFATAFGISSQWEFGARLIPQVTSIAAMIFIGWLLLSAMFVAPGEKEQLDMEGVPGRGEGGTQPTQTDVHFDISADYGDMNPAEITRRALKYFAWLLAFFAIGALVGLLPSMFLFMFLYMVIEGKERIGLSLIVSGGTWLLAYLLFHEVLVIPWPQSVLGDLFPVLRTIPELNLF
jgi:TctA family transporter